MKFGIIQKRLDQNLKYPSSYSKQGWMNNPIFFQVNIDKFKLNQ